MKTARIYYFKMYHAFLGGMLALLGFSSSCSKDDPRVEYGTPSAKFIVNGVIESKSTNEGIQDIQVVMKYDTVYSDANGSYTAEVHDFPMDQSFQLKFTDVDGTSNGEYQELDTIVTFTDPEFEDGDGHWYKGETHKTFNIKLIPKE